MAKYTIMGLIINHRSKKAAEVQQVLTKHGCTIKMRVGLHEAGDVCSEEGLVLLHLVGEDDEIAALEASLNHIEGVSAKTMSLGEDN